MNLKHGASGADQRPAVFYPSELKIDGWSHMNASEICKNIDIRIRPQAEILTLQVLSMADKLEEARQRMPIEELIVEYDNGGGQSGVRENPYYPAYEKLLASFVKSLTALQAMIGNNAGSEVDELGDLRSRFKVMG